MGRRLRAVERSNCEEQCGLRGLDGCVESGESSVGSDVRLASARRPTGKKQKPKPYRKTDNLVRFGDRFLGKNAHPYVWCSYFLPANDDSMYVDGSFSWYILGRHC